MMPAGAAAWTDWPNMRGMSDFKSFEWWNGYARMVKAKKAGIEQKQTKGTKQAELSPMV